MGYVEQALRPILNLVFNFNCSKRLLKSHHVLLVPVVAACCQLLLKSVSKLFENAEWSNSLLKHFKIQTLLKINCCMAAISAFGVTQHSQIFSLVFRNRIQCIALYQLHNSHAVLNFRRGYFVTEHLDKSNKGHVTGCNLLNSARLMFTWLCYVQPSQFTQSQN